MADVNRGTQPGALLNSPLGQQGPPPAANKSGGAFGSFSPVVLAVIGVLGAAFLLVSYYTVVARFCASRGIFRRRGGHPRHSNRVGDHDPDLDDPADDDWQGVDVTAYTFNRGLDEAIIKAIPVFKYQGIAPDTGPCEACACGKGAGKCTKCKKSTWSDMIGRSGRRSGNIWSSGRRSECSVCLNDFQHGELLRLLPKCNHTFHVLCIDTWFQSHSTCPLCRASIVTSVNPSQTLPPVPSTSSSAQASNLTDGALEEGLRPPTQASAEPPPLGPLPNDSSSGRALGVGVVISGNTSLTWNDSLDGKALLSHNLGSNSSSYYGDYGTRIKGGFNQMDQQRQEPLRRQMQQWGSMFRCCSTGRGMDCDWATDNVNGKAENRLATMAAMMQRSSSLSSSVAANIHSQGYGIANNVTSEQKNIDYQRCDNFDDVNAVHVVIAQSGSAPDASGSSTGKREFVKSRSLSHIVDGEKQLRGFKPSLEMDGRLLSRMLLSLTAPGAVNRSFSGGRFFGFQLKSAMDAPPGSSVG